MDLQPLLRELDEWSRHPTLTEPTQLQARMEALAFVGYVEKVVGRQPPTPTRRELRTRSAALKQRLTAVNRRLFDEMRERIRAGRTTPARWRRILATFSIYNPNERAPRHLGRDGLDALVNGILDVASDPSPSRAPEAEMVHCEFSTARVALDLVEHVALEQGDLFCDVGAGVGQMAMLVHLLSGVPTRGIEVDPGYCALGRRCIQALGLEDAVELVQQDARHAGYGTGTVFYLFTPFTGKILETVLDHLRRQAERRPITLCTFGTVTTRVEKLTGLRAVDTQRVHPYALGIFTNA